MHAALPLAALALGGCYVGFGLGYSGREYATAHASMGLVGHFGEGRGAVRAGAGAAIGGYEPADAQRGSIYPGPVVVGGFGRIVGNQHDALVANVDLHAPYGGQLGFRDPDATERATAGRAFVSLGYRHGWRSDETQHRGVAERGLGDDDGDASYEAGSVILSLGPELYWASSDSSAKPDDAELGVALSATFTMSAAALGRAFDKLTADDGP